jgi:hypothetical protein
VVGKMEAGYKTRHQGQIGVRGTLDSDAIGKILSDGVKLPETKGPTVLVHEANPPTAPVSKLAPGMKIGQHYVDAKGKVLIATREGLVPYARKSPTAEKMGKVVGLLDVADKVRTLMVAGDAKRVALAQVALKTQLDAWVKKYGNPHDDRRLMSALSHDPRRGLLRSLIRNNGTYADIVTKPTVFSEKYASKAVDPKDLDAVAKEVQRRTGLITAQAVATMYQGSKYKAAKDVQEALDSDPKYNRVANGWLTDDEYLYGDVRARLAEAKQLGNDRGVKKLEESMPPQ